MTFAPRQIDARNVEQPFEKRRAAVWSIMHIGIDKRGAALVAGTGIKVKQLVSFHLAWGWTLEHIHESFPQLTLDQIYAALAYYHDHQAAIDAELDADQQEAEQLAARHAPDPALMKRLRAP